jgi:cold shock CspA family protein
MISNSITGILENEQRVEYEIGEDGKRPCAVNVSRC